MNQKKLTETDDLQNEALGRIQTDDGQRFTNEEVMGHLVEVNLDSLPDEWL